MNLQQTCDPDRLDAFVRGELSEQQESELTAHLDRCAVCGGELERRVAAADQWREASELLTHHATRQSNVVDFAKDLSASGSLATSTTFAEQMDQVVSMLAPTDDPEMLGRRTTRGQAPSRSGRAVRDSTRGAQSRLAPRAPPARAARDHPWT